jgi:hypothetical protein
MKESNHQPLRMPYGLLRSFALDVEESTRNPGAASDNNDNTIRIIQTKRQHPTASSRSKIMGAGIINNMQESLYWNDHHPLCAISVELWVIRNLNIVRKAEQRRKPNQQYSTKRFQWNFQ